MMRADGAGRDPDLQRRRRLHVSLGGDVRGLHRRQRRRASGAQREDPETTTGTRPTPRERRSRPITVSRWSICRCDPPDERDRKSRRGRRAGTDHARRLSAAIRRSFSSGLPTLMRSFVRSSGARHQRTSRPCLLERAVDVLGALADLDQQEVGAPTRATSGPASPSSRSRRARWSSVAAHALARGSCGPPARRRRSPA